MSRIPSLIGLSLFTAAAATSPGGAGRTEVSREHWLPQLSVPHRPASLIVGDAYRRVLDDWSGGSLDQAVAARLDLDRRFAGDRSQCFERVRRQTLAELTTDDASHALAVLDFELVAWRQLLEEHEFYRASVLRTAIDDATERYLRRPRVERAEAADFYLGYALELFDTRYEKLVEQAPSILDRALDASPDHRAALHLSASLHEKRGAFRAADVRYDRLLKLEPEDAHARLHRAVNASRIDRRQAARELRAIAGGDGPPWHRQVAYQALVRQALEQDDLTLAAAIAGEAVDRLPDDASLAVLLAYVEVKQRRRPSSRVEALLSDTADQVETPSRVRYDAGDVELIETALERLDQARSQRRRRLAVGLRALALNDFRPLIFGCHGSERRLDPDFAARGPR